MDSGEAKGEATEALLAKLRDALRLELVEGTPPVYGFNADGWMLFRVRDDHTLGPSEYVAVRRETGEVRFLGRLGQ
jgi:hypothetical protein